MKRSTNICGIIGSNWRWLFAIFLLAWFVVNFIQAMVTEVMSDEAYYFLYGEQLAWGYYDHPPMVALMTAFSNLLFGGNLSVRFATLILQVFTLILIWKIIEEKGPDTRKVVLFFLLATSFIMFQVYGFVATPDAPFLFFTACFLLSYKKFLKEESWDHTLWLSLSMTGMVYSKYHAVLVVGLILLSNIRLLSRPKFWLAGLATLLCLLPHFQWQFVNDFPSFKYHLSDRSRSFRWSYFFEYLPNQLAVFNPFTFGAVVYVLIKYKARAIFERGLYFLIIGFLTFFWIMSFRGHVEPHWTVICSIPMLLLLYSRSMENSKLLHYVRHWVTWSLLLIVIARILLPTPILPERLDFSGKKEKNAELEALAGDLPVVFTGSFQGASKYHFFTGKEAFVLSAIDRRQTQFDIWQKELQFQGKPVFVPQWGRAVESFQSVNRVKINYTLPRTEVQAGDTLMIPFEIHNPSTHAIDFGHPEFPVTLKAAYILKREIDLADCLLSNPISYIIANQTINKCQLMTIVPDLSSGEYQFTLTLVDPLSAARNSAYLPLKINADSRTPLKQSPLADTD